MTVDEAVAAYSRLTSDRQIRVLANYAHNLTVVARGTYVPGTEDIDDPRRLRMLNELQHRVTGHLRQLLADDSQRYPNEIIVHIVTGEGDRELLTAFSAALRRCS